MTEPRLQGGEALTDDVLLSPMLLGLPSAIHNDPQSGYEFCQQLKRDKNLRGIPVILVTGETHRRISRRGVTQELLCMPQSRSSPKVCSAQCVCYILRNRCRVISAEDAGHESPLISRIPSALDLSSLPRNLLWYRIEQLANGSV